MCSQLEDIIFKFENILHECFEISIFYSSEELSKYLTDGSNFELIFLEVELKSVNGLEIGQKIREEMQDDITQIVYISKKASYAMELFDIRPLNFLIKPFKSEKIKWVLQEALRLNKNKNQYFEFKSARTLIRILIKDILYLESKGKKIRVISSKGIYEYYGKLSEEEKQLYGHEFFQIHKSYLVNYYHVICYQYDYVELTNNDILPISQQNRKLMSQWFTKHWEEKKLSEQLLKP